MSLRVLFSQGKVLPKSDATRFPKCSRQRPEVRGLLCACVATNSLSSLCLRRDPTGVCGEAGAN
eukprot:1554767-Prorocentrum_lima.AAC.1